MLEFPWAAPPLIQFPAPPHEIDTATGITAFLLQDMKYRDLVFKSGMGLLDAFEYIMSLVMIDCGSYHLQVSGKQFHCSAPFPHVMRELFNMDEQGCLFF